MEDAVPFGDDGLLRVEEGEVGQVLGEQGLGRGIPGLAVPALLRGKAGVDHVGAGAAAGGRGRARRSGPRRRTTIPAAGGRRWGCGACALIDWVLGEGGRGFGEGPADRGALGVEIRERALGALVHQRVFAGGQALPPNKRKICSRSRSIGYAGASATAS